MITFEISDLNQARTSLKVQQALSLGATLKKGLRLGTGDREINLLEFDQMEGVLVVDNADCQWGDYSFAQAEDLLNTDEMELQPVVEFRRDGDNILCLNNPAFFDAWRSKNPR